jgi:hypothetical protein
MAGKFSLKVGSTRYMPQICNMGQDGFYFPSEERRAEDFLALKNPTSSAGFEPANFCTKGHHAISIQTKPLYAALNMLIGRLAEYKQKREAPN